MNGLPELAKFFLVSNKLRPGGSLLEHVRPRNLSGLFSMQHNWWKNAKLPKEGYDLTVLFGNFMVVSTALWRDPRVRGESPWCQGAWWAPWGLVGGVGARAGKAPRWGRSPATGRARWPIATKRNARLAWRSRGVLTLTPCLAAGAGLAGAVHPERRPGAAPLAGAGRLCLCVVSGGPLGREAPGWRRMGGCSRALLFLLCSRQGCAVALAAAPLAAGANDLSWCLCLAADPAGGGGPSR